MFCAFFNILNQINDKILKYAFRISNTVVNADLAPTFLEMAGVPMQDHMDGRSLMRLIKAYRDPAKWVMKTLLCCNYYFIASLLSLSKLYDVPVGFVPPPLFWGSVLLYLRLPKSGCCSISDDLSCSYKGFSEAKCHIGITLSVSICIVVCLSVHLFVSPSVPQLFLE